MYCREPIRIARIKTTKFLADNWGDLGLKSDSFSAVVVGLIRCEFLLGASEWMTIFMVGEEAKKA